MNACIPSSYDVFSFLFKHKINLTSADGHGSGAIHDLNGIDAGSLHPCKKKPLRLSESQCMHAAAVIVQKICIMMIFCIFIYLYFSSLHAARLFWLVKNLAVPYKRLIMRVILVENRGGERKSKCSTFCVTYARAYELTSWFLLSWFDNLEVAESHVLELQRSLLEVF